MSSQFVLLVERLLDPASSWTFRPRCRASVCRSEIAKPRKESLARVCRARSCYGAPMSEAERAEATRGWKAVIAAHPIIFEVVIACISIGAVLGVFVLTDEWSLARRIAAGVVGGAGVGILITAPRIIG